MNRILIDDIKNVIINGPKKIIEADINNDYDILINNGNYKYILNINNANCNILFNPIDNNDLDIIININNSSLALNIISFVGININLNTLIKGDNSNLEIYNSIVNKNKISINMNVNHLSSNTLSNIYNCVVGEDEATCNIKVVSKVGKGYKNCNINQDSKIISSNRTNNKIEPILLIDEYDVNASHSAYIGQLSDKYLFYLMSRGLNKKEANDILLNAFLIGKLKIDNKEKEQLKNIIYGR